MTSKTKRSNAFPAELRERAVRLVREQDADPDAIIVAPARGFQALRSDH